MTRKELITSKEYWIETISNRIFSKYCESKPFNHEELAKAIVDDWFMSTIKELIALQGEENDNDLIDFTNWYLKVIKADSRFEVENQTLIDSFRAGDNPELWHVKYHGKDQGEEKHLTDEEIDKKIFEMLSEMKPYTKNYVPTSTAEYMQRVARYVREFYENKEE